jgi:hypothetical protein
MVGADAGSGDGGQRVVLLAEQLTGRVEADRTGSVFVEQRPRPAHDRVHRGVPVGLDEPVAVADQRGGEPVGRVVGLPAEEILDVHAAAVHPIPCAATHAGDSSAHHRDVHRVAVGVQQRSGRHPSLDHVRCHALGVVLVHASRPLGARRVWRPLSPEISDPIHNDLLPAGEAFSRLPNSARG